MKYCTVLLIICSFILLSVKAVDQQSSEFEMSFAGNLYPPNPMRNVQTLTQKLWGYVDGAYQHSEIRDRFLASQEYFVEQVLALHSLIDVLLLSLEKQVHECPDCVVQALRDFEHIFDGLSALTERYGILTEQIKDNFSITAHYTLSKILKKIREVLQTGQISTPLYAFFISDTVYSKLTTPLLPPANIPPVAPMA